MENNMEYLPTHPYRQEEFDENAASLRLTSNSQPCEKPQPHFRRLQGPGGVVSGNKCGEHSTFHPFERLPAEIQRTIWSLSLPGPRLLSVGRMATTAIYFPKEHHTPNPAALSVCRTSRDEALKRYRIAFGTEHVYADFARDILYFGPWNRESDFSLLWLLGFTKSGRLDYRQTSLKVTDLDCVTRIALTFNLLDRYAKWGRARKPPGSIPDGGALRLRRALRQFCNLKLVLFCCGGKDEADCRYPGQVVFEKTIRMLMNP